MVSRRHFLGSTTVLKAHTLPIHILPIVVHPQTKTELCFLAHDLHCLFLPHGLLTSTHRYSSVLGLAQRARNCVFFHPRFSLRRGHSGGQSCVCFSLPIHGLYICCLYPAVNLVFLSILGLCKLLGDFTVQIGSLIFPTLLTVFAVVFFTFWGLL